MSAKTIDKIWTTLLITISTFVVFLLIALITTILIRGNGFLNLAFIFGNSKTGEAGGGIGPQLFNSFYLLILSLIITLPLGIGAGIYLAEYAKKGIMLKIVRLCIDTMASLPSIVVGLFGMLIFVIYTHWKFTILAGAFALTILNLPALTRVCENAIKAASKNVKEASLGLGATRFQTILKVVLPNAIPQIITGIILAAGRIFGEAAALMYTAGMVANNLNFYINKIGTKQSSLYLMKSGESLAVHIWKLTSEGTVPDAAKIANNASAILIVMVLLFNITARLLGNKIHKSFTGQN